MRERKRGGRAAHVLLHLEHGGLGLDVEPAGIEADALADERDARIIHITPGQIDQARLPRGGAADRMNERKILPQQIVADRGPGAGAVLGGKRARGLFEIGRSHVVRRRVDEVAHQRHRFDHALEIFAVEALRQIELDLAAFGLVVARKAISAERESERRKPRVVRIVGKTVDAAPADCCGSRPGRNRSLASLAFSRPNRMPLKPPSPGSARYWSGFGSKPAASANVRAAALSRSRTSL